MHQLARRVTAALSATAAWPSPPASSSYPPTPPRAPAPTPSPSRAAPPPRSPPRSARAGRSAPSTPRPAPPGSRSCARGGNAVDAAVAAAATLGVTEPYSAGIGGGGYFVYYDAKTGKVHTIDGRETAPGEDAPRRVHRPGHRQALPVHPATWSPAASRSARPAPPPPGTAPSRTGARAPWVTGARAGHQGRHARVRRRRDLPPADARQRDPLPRVQGHRKLFLAGGDARRSAPSSATRELAPHLHPARRAGPALLLHGQARRPHVRRVGRPRTTSTTTSPSRPGTCPAGTSRNYEVLEQKPTKVSYRGYDVYGMAPSSSGGTTVGEALNILERYPLGTTSARGRARTTTSRPAPWPSPTAASTSATRPTSTYRPADLLSDTFAAERACAINPAKALPKPTAAGDVTSYDGVCPVAAAAKGDGRRRHGEHLDHQPHRRRQVGQRRRVHPHHRADRRLRAWSCRATASCSTTS